MSTLNPFDSKFWIDYDHDTARSNVIHLNVGHARANAAQAALLLETDRVATRRAEIRMKLERIRRHKDRLDGLIDALSLEDQLLEVPFHD